MQQNLRRSVWPVLARPLSNKKGLGNRMCTACGTACGTAYGTVDSAVVYG